MKKPVFFSAFLLFVGITTAVAQPQERISFQGQLTDTGGDPVPDASYNMTFALYSVLSGGSDLWTEAQSVSTSGGIYSVELGSSTGLGDVDFSQTLYLGVKVGTDPEMSPRTRLTSVPNALNLRGLRVVPTSLAPNLIGGDESNTAGSVVAATISGGGLDDGFTILPNTVDADYGTIGGGLGNTVNAGTGTIAGGSTNTADGQNAFIGGGVSNIAGGVGSVVGGGDRNEIQADYGIIVGGAPWDGTLATRNIIFDDFGFIGGGSNNHAGFDDGNTGIQRFATVGGGIDNRASGDRSSILGGWNNRSPGAWAAVGGGNDNEASGQASTIPGGLSNTALGTLSFAAGRRAKANHFGTFVWADFVDADFASTGSNQFLVRAGAGVGINIDNPQEALHVAGAARADKLVYNAPRIHYASIPAVGFRPGPSDPYVISTLGESTYITGGISRGMFAEIQLPHDAEITAFTCTVFDNAADDLDCGLYEVVSGTSSDIAIVSSSGAPGKFTDTAVVNPAIPVDNSTNAYLVRVSTTTNPWGTSGSNLQIIHASIEYTLSEAQ